MTEKKLLSTVTKTLLKNVIRHTDSHNKVVEESEMWRQRKKEIRGAESRGSSYSFLKDRGVDMRYEFSAAKDRRAHMDEEPRSTYWMKQLYKAEENDNDRWGHSGFKELYPEHFESADDGSNSDDGHQVKNHKDRHRHEKKKERKKKKRKRKHSDSDADSYLDENGEKKGRKRKHRCSSDTNSGKDDRMRIKKTRHKSDSNTDLSTNNERLEKERNIQEKFSDLVSYSDEDRQNERRKKHKSDLDYSLDSDMVEDRQKKKKHKNKEKKKKRKHKKKKHRNDLES